MDTAKVDIRKLQLLNDRINQCIDALNQVRLSVHGLSHSSAAAQNLPFGQIPSGITPLGAGYVPGYGAVQGGVPGVIGQPAFTPLSVGTAVPFGWTGIPVNPALGLSHTSADPWSDPTRQITADPVLMARIAQTFPFAYYAVGTSY